MQSLSIVDVFDEDADRVAGVGRSPCMTDINEREPL
jgi:hypothetical protein